MKTKILAIYKVTYTEVIYIVLVVLFGLLSYYERITYLGKVKKKNNSKTLTKDIIGLLL
jgi:hypothetical protein